VSPSSLANNRVAQGNTEQAASPQLLVSVRDAAEAAAALAGGADWIDLKEPLAGALGPVDPTTAREVVQLVGGRCPVSAALGELTTWTNSSDRQLLDVPGIDFVKLGLAGCSDTDCWTKIWLKAQQDIRQAGRSLVAVAYADWQLARSPEPEEIVALARQSSCQYLLIDTFSKTSSGTLGRLGSAGLGSLLQLAQQHSLRTVVAGKIGLEELDQLPATSIDMVAIRGSACPGDRRGKVEGRLVERFRSRMAERWPR
jgi:uncharacterized protein (UPF0264 family)